MQSLIGKYGSTLWEAPISKEDADWYNGGGPERLSGHQGMIGKIIAEEGDIITMYTPERTMQFFKREFHVYETPDFSWGDKVRIIDKNIEGEISSFFWHFKTNQYFYFIKANGKILKKRYRALDLEKL